ncbi:hypothetical protein WCLP8_4240013 [uncultured Gammaproteobacteria bacterium]
MLFSTLPMDLLQDLHAVETTDSGILVHTHCLYPSHLQVCVRISPLPDGHFRVSDDAGGLAEVLSMGLETKKPGSFIAGCATRYGLNYNRGEVAITVENAGKLAAAVMLVANASKDGVMQTAIAHPMRDTPSFDFAFSNFVHACYDGKFRPGLIAGASGTHRKFRYIHHRGQTLEVSPNDRIVLVEPVSPSQMGIAVKVQAHRDILERKLPNLWQCLVVDRETDEWHPSDLATLKQGGVQWMEFAQAEQELSRYVH